MSRTPNIIYHLLGMVISSGYFIFDFFRLGHTENTWEKAIQLKMSIYLDFLNCCSSTLPLTTCDKRT